MPRPRNLTLSTKVELTKTTSELALTDLLLNPMSEVFGTVQKSGELNKIFKMYSIYL